MRSVQEVLKLVANAGEYGVTEKFMCYALGSAERRGLITKAEKAKACRSIDRYLSRFAASRGLLCNCINPDGTACESENGSVMSYWSFPTLHGIRIYSNWDNRPRP